MRAHSYRPISVRGMPQVVNEHYRQNACAYSAARRRLHHRASAAASRDASPSPAHENADIGGRSPMMRRRGDMNWLAFLAKIAAIKTRAGRAGQLAPCK